MAMPGSKTEPGIVLHALIGDGDIPGMKIGNAYRVPKINVIRYALSAGNPQPAA